MWLSWILVLVVLLAALGGVVAGGIYAAVLLPIAAIFLIAAFAAGLKRARDPELRRRQDEPLSMNVGPLDPEAAAAQHEAEVHPDVTPGQLTDARRSEQ
jgi:hypothetical protein